MSVIGSNILAGSAGQGGGYTIERSVRLRSSASAYFNRTFGTPTNQKIGTFSFWVKRGSLGARRTLVSNVTGSVYGYWEFDSSDRLNFGDFFAGNWTSTAVYRDPSAWYHIVIALDSTAAVNANRIKVYVNNRQDTTGSATITQNSNWYLLQNSSAQIGAFTNISTYFDGYLTEVNFIDGQALTPSDFGNYNEDTGVWQPAKYAGTYGTNGFYLPFNDNTTTTTLAADASGNGNDWTPNNISLTSGATYDSMTDTPTPYADGGNYAVLNPLMQRWAVASASFSNANLQITTTGGSTSFGFGTQEVSSGKWYFETLVSAIGAATPAIGVTTSRAQATVQTDSVVYLSNGQKEVGGTASSYGATYTTNDLIGVALDCDAGTVTFYKNNTSQGLISLVTSAGMLPHFQVISNSVFAANFGQRPFAYTPPTGFLPLHTGNLPDSAIVDGSEYFNTVLWTGDGTSSHAITGVGFQPDFTWIKGRSGARGHALYDAVRGATNYLTSSGTIAEATVSGIDSFDSDGFTVGSDISSNESSTTFVGWNWKANGAGVSNTDGSITSTVSANPTSGFSIVTYTGTGSNATVGHGLGVAPAMVIVKARDSAGWLWCVYHASVGATGFLRLNATDATTTSSTAWQNTSPTSTVFSIGTEGAVNYNSSTNYVAYCFAEVPGFSKFGSYTGNGSADGPFVYTGFRPALTIVKRTDASGNSWRMHDDKRGFNGAIDRLHANLNYADVTGTTDLDILSNGFKVRTTSTDQNASGATYIYMAFAENPFKNSLAR